MSEPDRSKVRRYRWRPSGKVIEKQIKELGDLLEMRAGLVPYPRGAKFTFELEIPIPSFGPATHPPINVPGQPVNAESEAFFRNLYANIGGILMSSADYATGQGADVIGDELVAETLRRVALNPLPPITPITLPPYPPEEKIFLDPTEYNIIF